ncbi:MAG: energy-coupling factor transporter transmembrane component T [Lentisphaerota bacterium]
MSCHSAQQLDLLGYGHTRIHRLDSRIKLISALVFILCVASFPKYAVSALIPLAAIPWFMGILGQVPWRPVFRLILAASPFALMVGLFNPWLDPHKILIAGSLHLSAGWWSMLSILIRFLLTTSMILVVVSTTSLPGLLHGMIQLKIPRPFVTQLQFLYRYLFLLVSEGQQLSRARALREPGRKHPSISLARKMLSSLLWRTWERAGRVYQCMKARGFRGDFPSFHASHFHTVDIVFLAACAVFCLAARFVPITHWLGRVMLKMTS